MNAFSAAELAARNSYGRLIAYLAVRTRDVAAAEDALGDAFLQALKTWPTNGVPAKPEAWLLTTARRKLIDSARRKSIHTKSLNLLNLTGVESVTPWDEMTSFPDERLKLLFVCAHPAIDSKLHTPLMLQTVLGFNAAQIGSAFLVAPATMGQRLVRVKAKIRDAGIPFEIPSDQALEMRSQAVLSAIYVAYNADWSTVAGIENAGHASLTSEAIWLAKLCRQLMSKDPEVLGLLALMLYCESRRNARHTSAGQYIPLSEQDTALWSKSVIAEAEQSLTQAATFKSIGRFQLEAAIQSIHAQRIHAKATDLKTTDWDSLLKLYEGLVEIAPSVGAQVGYAAAIAQSKGPSPALAYLETITSTGLQTYQPYWAVKADLLQQLGRLDSAQQAYQRAIGLSEDPAVRTFLIEKSTCD
ncbi:MAG: DUF6596 domain-containing protein [Cyanobacteria bacterium P01_C01_bin.121]